jgi:hypothetical protein
MRYLFIEWSFVVLTISCVAMLIYGLRNGLQKQEVADSTTIVKITVVSIVLWTLLISVLAYNDFFLDFSTIPPRLVVVLIPPMLILVMLSRKPWVRHTLNNIPVTWILYLQGFRFFVELLLWGLYALNLIPIQMTFEGRNFDILIGITAPIVGMLYDRGLINALFLKVWNVAGILVLANIVITAILSMPLPFRVFMNDPANIQVVIFPIIWLPAILVPMAYYLHVFSLIQLKGK